MPPKLTRRSGRLGHIAALERAANQRAREQRAESEGVESMLVDDDDDEEPIQPDFATNFDPVELDLQLQQARDDISQIFESIELDGNDDVDITTQDEELAPVDELQQLADFQNIHEPEPAEDEMTDEEAEDVDAIEEQALMGEPPVVQPEDGTPDVPGGSLHSARQMPWTVEDVTAIQQCS